MEMEDYDSEVYDQLDRLSMSISTQRVLNPSCPRDGSTLQYASANDRHYCPNCTYSIDDKVLYDDIAFSRRALPKEEPRKWGADPKPEKKCECGVDSVGGGKHSKWCPLYTEDE